MSSLKIPRVPPSYTKCDLCKQSKANDCSECLICSKKIHYHSDCFSKWENTISENFDKSIEISSSTNEETYQQLYICTECQVEHCHLCNYIHEETMVGARWVINETVEPITWSYSRLLTVGNDSQHLKNNDMVYCKKNKAAGTFRVIEVLNNGRIVKVSKNSRNESEMSISSDSNDSGSLGAEDHTHSTSIGIEKDFAMNLEIVNKNYAVYDQFTEETELQTNIVLAKSETFGKTVSDLFNTYFLLDNFNEHTIDPIKIMHDVEQMKWEKGHTIELLESLIEESSSNPQRRMFESLKEALLKIWAFHMDNDGTQCFNGSFIHPSTLEQFVLSFNIYKKVNDNNEYSPRHIALSYTDALYHSSYDYNNKDCGFGSSDNEAKKTSIIVQMLNKNSNLSAMFKEININDPELKNTKGAMILNYKGKSHFNTVVVKFPTKDVPTTDPMSNGLVYVIDHTNASPSSNIGTTIWYAKLCGMFYAYFFGGNNSPYSGSSDMNFSLPTTKEEALRMNTHLKKEEWSRFDYDFIEEEQIIVQHQHFMCGPWSIVEVLHFIHDFEAIETDTVNCSKRRYNIEVDVRKRMTFFQTGYIKAYCEHAAEMNVGYLSSSSSSKKSSPKPPTIVAETDNDEHLGNHVARAQAIIAASSAATDNTTTTAMNNENTIVAETDNDEHLGNHVARAQAIIAANRAATDNTTTTAMNNEKYDHNEDDDTDLSTNPKTSMKRKIQSSTTSTEKRNKPRKSISGNSLETRYGKSLPTRLTKKIKYPNGRNLAHGLTGNKAKDTKFTKIQDLAIQKLASSYPIDSTSEINQNDTVSKYSEMYKNYTMNAWTLKKSHKAPAKHTLKLKINNNKFKNPEVATLIHTAIMNIAVRSFVCQQESPTIMIEFIQRLLFKYDVLVVEKEIEFRNRPSDYRIISFIIVETAVPFSSDEADTGCIIHLIATAPEARGFGAATTLIQHVATNMMSNKEVLLAIMYPEMLLPCSLNLKDVEADSLKYLKKKGKRGEDHHLKRYQDSSSVWFWVQTMKFLHWDHYDKYLSTQPDLVDTICLYSEVLNVKDLKLKEVKLLKVVEIHTGTYSCVQMSYTNDEEAKLEFRIKNIVLGWIPFVTMTLAELNHQMSLLYNNFRNLDYNGLFGNNNIVDIIKIICEQGGPKTMSKSVRDACKKSFDEKQFTDNTETSWTGAITKTITQGANHFRYNALDKINNDSLSRSQRRILDFEEIHTIPKRYNQQDSEFSEACATMSLCLLLHSKARQVATAFFASIQRLSKDEVSHMSLFTNRNIQTSLIDVLNDHGFYMKRDGTENEESVVANKRKGMYLCEMKFINGLRHVIGIDYDYMIIWDPTYQTALPLVKEFFELNVNCTKKKKPQTLQMFKISPFQKKKPRYWSWLGKQVTFNLGNKVIKGEVMVIDEWDNIVKDNKFIIVTIDPKQIIKIKRDLVKKVESNK